MSRMPLTRIVLLQFLTALVLLSCVLGAGFYLWTKHQSVGVILHDLAPRYARLQGLLLHRADLQSLGAKVNAELMRIAYPAGQDVTKASNDAQQRIRSVFIDSKMDVISIQVLPAKQEAGFDRVQINLRVEGDLTGVQSALAKLSVQSPTVIVDSLTLQTIGAVRPASVQRLGGQLSLTVYRMRS